MAAPTRGATFSSPISPLAVLPAGELRWTGASEPRYPGYREVRSTPTWDLLLPEGESPGGAGDVPPWTAWPPGR